MDKVAVLKALADESRMRLLTLLLDHPYCVRGLARRLSLSDATVSQHLKVLREAGLVVGERRGYFMHYAVERSVLQALAAELQAMARSKGCERDKEGGTDGHCPGHES